MSIWGDVVEDILNPNLGRLVLPAFLSKIFLLSAMLSTGCLLTQLHKDQKLFRGDIAGHLMFAEASAVFKI